MTIAGTLVSRIQRALELAHATLSEIFDESAYTRFLHRQGLTASPDSYAQFLRESEGARARRARCC
jgi:hypothetical protein